MSGTANLWALTVSTLSEGQVKCALDDPKGNEIADSYFSLAEANILAAKLRAAAAEWAADFKDGAFNERARWRRLHELGEQCFFCIFADAADHVDQCLAAAPSDTEIRVNQDSSDLRMPWGLLCNPGAVALSTAEPVQLLLWSAKYNVRTRLGYGRSSPRKQDRWSFSAVLCKPTYAKGLSMLPSESAPLANSIAAVCRSPLDRTRPADAAPNCFLYVHSHSQAAAGSLIFKPSDGGLDIEVTAAEIVRSVGSPFNRGVVVAVLNACESANLFTGLASALVLQSYNMEVACVATEVAVDQRFAMQFGLELIDRCVQRGESTVAAMKAMRRKHYPLSTIYSHYGKSDLTTDPPIAVFDVDQLNAFRASVESANYSNP